MMLTMDDTNNIGIQATIKELSDLEKDISFLIERVTGEKDKFSEASKKRYPVLIGFILMIRFAIDDEPVHANDKGVLQ